LQFDLIAIFLLNFLHPFLKVNASYLIGVPLIRFKNLFGSLCCLGAALGRDQSGHRAFLCQTKGIAGINPHTSLPGNQPFINPQSVVGNQLQGNQPETRAISLTISQFILGN
jgi:hypothetical protein